MGLWHECIIRTGYQTGTCDGPVLGIALSKTGEKDESPSTGVTHSRPAGGRVSASAWRVPAFRPAAMRTPLGDHGWKFLSEGNQSRTRRVRPCFRLLLLLRVEPSSSSLHAPPNLLLPQLLLLQLLLLLPRVEPSSSSLHAPPRLLLLPLLLLLLLPVLLRVKLSPSSLHKPPCSLLLLPGSGWDGF